MLAAKVQMEVKPPKKSVAELSSLLEQKIEHFDSQGLDYLNWLADQAISMSDRQRGDPLGLFLSDNFKVFA